MIDEKQKQHMIDQMSSICKNCKHIEVLDDIKRFRCTKFDIIMMGVILNCPKGFENKA
jgi:hypothetical protein